MLSYPDTIRNKLLQNMGRIPGWLSPHEGLLLYVLAKTGTGIGDIVEIGSYKGKSTACLAFGAEQSAKKGMVWAVDPHEGIINNRQSRKKSTYPEFISNLEKSGCRDSVNPVVKTSKVASRGWHLPIRLLFVDGLHDFEHATEDYLHWNRHVSNGGIMAFHDGFCGQPGVMQAIIKYILSASNIIQVGTVGSILYAVKGKSSGKTRIMVRIKAGLIRLAFRINRSPKMPEMIKNLIIHRFIRMLLLNNYTNRVYLNL